MDIIELLSDELGNDAAPLHIIQFITDHVSGTHGREQFLLAWDAAISLTTAAQKALVLLEQEALHA